MQQSSATPKNQDVGIGLRKIFVYSHSSLQCLLVSTVFGMVSSLFILIFTCICRDGVEKSLHTPDWGI